MKARFTEAENGKQRAAAVARSAEVAARRPILVGVLLTVALLTLFAIGTRPSGAATMAKPAVTTPRVSPVTVTVPGQSAPAPPVTAPPVTPPPTTPPPVTTPTPTPTPTAPPAKVVTPSVTSTPPRSTPAAPSARTPPVTLVTTRVGGKGSAAAHPAHRARRAPHGGGPAAGLRSVVVRLSSCVSRLEPRGQRLLLLRAGIGTAGPTSRRAVARRLRISVAREARSERAALGKLRSAARRGKCGSTPAWIHVPAANRLVLIDPALTVSQPAVTGQRTKVSLRLSPSTGSRLISGSEWRRLVLIPAQQS